MRTWLWAAVLAAGVTGCGSEAASGPEPVYPVTGVITFQGRPVAGADVTFFNADKNRSAFGKTNAQGKFNLSTFALNDGAVEGSHVVTVAKVTAPPPTTTPAAPLESEEYVPPGIGESTQPEAPKSELPEQYADPETSGLTANVQAGPNEISFDLK
jgi:hypothetical protein